MMTCSSSTVAECLQFEGERSNQHLAACSISSAARSSVCLLCDRPRQSTLHGNQGGDHDVVGQGQTRRGAEASEAQ